MEALLLKLALEALKKAIKALGRTQCPDVPVIKMCSRVADDIEKHFEAIEEKKVEAVQEMKRVIKGHAKRDEVERGQECLPVADRI